MTDRDRHRRATEIFLQACELLPDEQAAFITRACGEDTALRFEVESLLEHDRQAADAGDTGRYEEMVGRAADEAVGYQKASVESGPEPGQRTGGSKVSRPGMPERSRADLRGALPDRIGRYRIVRLIARGGMGEVYEAEQSTPVKRRVALKVIRAGLDSAEVLARFMAERQALALMSHPHIAAIHDAGATREGRPYVVMEYVDGEPVTEYAERHRLDLGSRLDLFLKICEAVSHAHQKGVIHRDLKPSNILVSRSDGLAVPKVIDFGIAKATQQPLTERTLETSLGQLVGTPEYMSPEQAAGTGLDVDTRTDVYALGAVLYELLAGTNPLPREALRRAGLEEMLRLIREHEPARPSLRVSTLSRDLPEASRPERATLARRLAGDLDWITLRALEKDRERRYGSAADLAEDIRRYRRHEPVTAGPPGRSYRLKKFVQRNRAGVAFGMALAAVLLASAAAVAWQWRTAVAERERAEAEARKSSQVVRFMQETLTEAIPGRSGSDVTVIDALGRILQRLDFELADQPLLMAAVCETVGVLYRSFTMYDDAEKLLNRALEIRKRHLSPEDPDLAASYIQLAGLRVLQDLPAEAVPLAREGIGILRSLRRSRPDDLADGLNTLGIALRKLGRYEEARNVLEEAVTFANRIPDDHFTTREIRSTSTESLAGVLRRLGDYGAAAGLMREVVALRKTLTPHPESAGIATALYNLAAVLQLQGDFKEAVGVLREALAMEKVIFGAENPWTAITMNQLAQALLDTGEFAAADEQVRQAIAIHRAAGPNYGRRLGEDLLTLARIDLALARTGDSLAHSEEAGRLLGEALGPQHAAMARVLGVQAELARLEGDRARAAQLLEGQLAVLVSALPADHPDLAEARCQQARMMMLGDRRQEALATSSEAVKSLESSLGAEHPRWALAARIHAANLMDAGRPQEAEALLERAVTTLTGRLGPGHHSVGEAGREWARCLRLMGRTVEAQQIAREARSVLLASYGGDHPETARAMMESARILHDLGQDADAARWAGQALSVWQHHPPADPASEIEARALADSQAAPDPRTGSPGGG